MLSLQQHIVSAFLFALMEAALRLSVAPRALALYSILHRRDRVKVLHHVRSAMEDGFLLQCAYIDEFCEVVGILTAFPASIMIRARYGQGLNLNIIGVSFVIQLALEIFGDMVYSLWEAGVLGFRRKTALWCYYQSQNSYVKHAFVSVLACPLLCALWLQAAVLGVPSST